MQWFLSLKVLKEKKAEVFQLPRLSLLFTLSCQLHAETLEPVHLCVLPVVRVPGRERRLLETMQLAIGEFITDSSQGLPPSPRM